MIETPTAVQVPLNTDEDGRIRVSGTRVTLHTLINYYRQGETPEDLHEAFPTVPLADIYAVIAYYLANHEAVEVYLHEADEKAGRIRAEWEARHPPPTRAELLARLETKQRDE